MNFDWNQARAFLVTAEEGSLSAAARALGSTQPTVGRQVAALEEALEVTLFDRAGRTLILTPAGTTLLEHVQAMGRSANDFALGASGQSQTIEGSVSITATNIMATFHLPPLLRVIREAAPGIEIEIIETNEVRDLRRREADIAIRHGQPEHPELIAQRIADETVRLYGATRYLDKIGRPEKPEDLARADFIGFEHPERLVPVFAQIGLPLARDNFRLTTTSGTVILALLQEGLGLALLPDAVAAKVPGLECVLPDRSPISVPTWLVTHRELKTSARIRLVYDLLARELKKLAKDIQAP